MDRSEHLARAARAIALLPEGIAPSREMLAELRYGWGNDVWSADLGYLEDLALRAATASGPILECGSGATTLLLSALAAKRGVEVWALEHLPEWYLYVVAAITQLKLPPVNVCLCALQDYGEFSWYALPSTQLPDRFGLVVCDGPPGPTKGGRFGLWPMLSSHFVPGTIIMLDDIDRKDERAVLQRWTALSGGTTTTKGSFATLMIPS